MSGFPDAPRDAAVAFRAILTALSRPGTIHAVTGAVPPAPLSPAAGVVVLTLVDRTTGLWLAPSCDTPAVRDWITFHTGAPLVAATDAAFALGGWAEMLPLSRFAQGAPDYPDRSATLIIDLPDLRAEGARLTGPGIRDVAHLSLPETAAFAENARAFPLGLDFIFTAGGRIAALPRTTRVEDC